MRSADVSSPPIKVRIPYKPRRWALGVHASVARWVLILHRRAGKTTGVINHHQRAATNDVWEAQRLRALKPSLTDTELEKLVHPPGGRHYGHVMPHTIWDALKFYAG